jgi:hypothetical protein
MTPHPQRPRWRCYFVLALVGAALPPGAARAQGPFVTSSDWWAQPSLGRDMVSAIWKGESPQAPTPPGRSVRFRMFGMVPGFINGPVGLDSDDDPAVNDDPFARAVMGQGDNAPGGLQLSMGNDNPYFDLRRPTDPGGLGFFRVYSQLQLFDTGTTSVALNLQAVTPAGQQFGGLNEGPTVLTPGVSVFQELGLGTALQGFVGQNIRTAQRPNDPFGRDLKCGLGVQCPVLEFGGRDRGLYLFLQALGQYYYGDDRPANCGPALQFVPGVHWRCGEKCWFSLGASRYSLLTCSWQF